MTDRPNAHDALLGATSELTYEYGITGTGVDAIAARAGVTKRTLYQHFGSKDRLVAEALNDRNRRALLALETNARRRSEETGELVILALFDVIENALRTKTKAGCAFINASLEINRPGHPVREAALAHLRADALAVLGSNSTPARPEAEYRISLCRINDSAERLTVGVAAVTLFGCCAIQM